MSDGDDTSGTGVTGNSSAGTDVPDADRSPAAPPKSTAAAAARRARRIAGPARSAARATATTEPVNPAKPPSQLAGGSAAARWLPAAVLIAAAVTMAVLLVTFSHRVWWAKPSSAAGQSGAGKPTGGVASTDGAVNELRERVLAAAKQCVVATNQYNYKTLDADEAAGARCTTGVQTSRYKSAMEHLIRKTAIKIKASQVPQINTAGIESVTDDGKQWSIVVYGQLAIHSTNVKARTDPFAAVVRMDYVDGKWLMADLQTLQEPTS